GEINLPPRQNGSSIMPGKINPVIPEVISQISFDIIGNDLTITMAAEAGQLELNAFEPILFHNLFTSLAMLTNGVETFTKNCICGITANENRCLDLLNKSTALATALCPYIGYDNATALVKEALRTGVEIKTLVEHSGLIDKKQLSLIFPQQFREIS
ncbi:MAG: aspartate ammonia-lyase, partial [Firmicutes bacterium]|nr:aspartate ammonia-lyase [Bacillota bacterium]